MLDAALRRLALGLLLLALGACRGAGVAPAPTIIAGGRETAATPTSLPRCAPTTDDGVSPSYRPDTPVRSVAGRGHVLSGIVRSSRDCRPIARAQLEVWPELGLSGHPDAARATLFTDPDGRYRFECDPPDHIHMRVSAPGYRTIGVNSYHPHGQTAGTLDLVLVPQLP